MALSRLLSAHKLYDLGSFTLLLQIFMYCVCVWGKQAVITSQSDVSCSPASRAGNHAAEADLS